MLINIFKIVSKDENEAGKTWMVSIYPQGGYIDKDHRFYPQSNSNSEWKKIFKFSVLHNNRLLNPKGF